MRTCDNTDEGKYFTSFAVEYVTNNVKKARKHVCLNILWMEFGNTLMSVYTQLVNSIQSIVPVADGSVCLKY